MFRTGLTEDDMLNLNTYKEKVIPYFKKEFGIKNDLAVPVIEKIIVNAGIGKEVTNDPKFLETALSDLAKITGQLPKVSKSKKAISGFKLREGAPTGLVVTLRRKKMDDFFTKLVNVVFPRIRDFRGVKNTALDDFGNLNIGISEHTVFLEIKPDQVTKPFSFQVNIVTNTKDKKQAKALFEQLGIIFEK